MERIDPAKVQAARRALAGVRQDWLSRPGVTGVDVGFRLVGGTLRDVIAIRVYVAHKRDPDELREGERFPRSVQGVPIDVIEFSPETKPPCQEPAC